MAQPFVISMKAYLDAQGVKTGSREAERVLADLNRKAAATEGSLKAQIERGAGIGASARGFREAEADVSAYGQEMDRLRAQFNPLYAASKRYEVELNEINRAHRVGAISATEQAGAIAALDQRYTAATLAANRNAAAVRNGIAAFKGSSFNVANVAAQFQDIGVTAAMGMNSLQIGLQQGTQLAAVLAMMENPVRGLGQAFASILSPVSLLTIGLVALGAAGIQMIDWSQVAKSALNGVADGLVNVAPYAALAAGALALLYAPAIIGGLATVVASLGAVASAVAGVAAAIYATVGLPVLLVAAFTAMVAAAVIWRDDLTGMLGIDIVGAAQDGLNSIIGVFVGGFNAVKDTWDLLPGAFKDLFTLAMNNAIDVVQNGVNGIIGPLNNILSAAHLPTISEADLAEWKGEVTGAAGDVMKTINKDFADAQGPDYVGKVVKGVKDAASGAAGALRGLANSIHGPIGKAAEKAEKSYHKIVQSARESIASQRLAAQTLGMTAEAANRLRYAHDLLNQALRAGVKVTPQQRKELEGLAAEMAATEARTTRLTQIFDFGRDTLRSFFSDFAHGIQQGKSLWEDFGNAAANVLNSIADRALQMAADGIWNLIWGGISGALGGGFGGLGNSIGAGSTWSGVQSFLASANGNVFPANDNGLGRYRNSVVDRPTLFPFARGIGLMGEAGPEAIVPLGRNARGQLGVNVVNPGMGSANENGAAGANSNTPPVTYAPTYNLGVASAGELRRIRQQDREEFRREFPALYRDAQRRAKLA